MTDEAQTCRIMIADDHVLLVDAIASAMKTRGSYEIAKANSFPDLYKALDAGAQFDLILLDLRMPGMNGMDSIRKLLADCPDTRIVLFSGNAEPKLVRSAMREGVAGFIPKTMPMPAMLTAVEMIEQGQVFVPANVTLHAEDAGKAKEDLTEIELQILRRVSDGLTNKEIALEIDTSEANVKMFLRAINGKLGTRNRTHAAMLAHDLGLI